MFIGIDEPTHSLRMGRDREGPLLVVLGPSFQTGHDGDVAERFRDLEKWVRIINWVAVLGGLSAPAGRDTWNRKTSKDRFFHQFKDWNFGWINFADLICETKIYEFPMYDRDPLPRWSFGRVTLLGDAAHPMRPVGAQAGSQAIVDARVLALALATAPTAVRALEIYDQQRRPIMNAVAIRNRNSGPTIVMELAEQRAPKGFKDIESVIPRRELEAISLAYKVKAGFDPAALNQRPSSTVRRSILGVAQ
jgi:hypothetical protein